MAIGTAAKRKRILAAEAKDFPQATTHFPNETTKPGEESGFEVRNQQEWNDILIDPDEDGGDTHFTNEQEYNDKTNGRVRTEARVKTKATTRDSKKIEALLARAMGKKTTAAEVDTENDEASGYTKAEVPGPGEDKNATFPAGGENSGTNVKAKKKVKANEDEFDENGTRVVAEEGPQADTHFPNGEESEPADGYLMVGDVEDLEEEEADDEFPEDEDEVDADALEFGEAPQQSLLDATDEHEVDAEFEEFEGEPHEEGEPDAVEDDAIEDEADEEGFVLGAADEQDLADVDGLDDEGDDVMFASAGMQLYAIKAHRIVARMSKKVAVKAGVQDIYLSEQFELATAAEMAKHGLRAGLKKQGFAMAKVNVAKNEVLNKRVESKVKQVTAAIRRNQLNSNEALGQCLAIAAVGINRQYFKDARNELRAALEDELTAAGVRGASRLVRRVFASKGIDYAKSILTLANKLVNMPEETRNAFAAALDMTSDGEVEDDVDEGDDMYGQESSPDFQEEAGFDEGDEDFVDHFEEEDEAPETVHAALLRPATKIKASAKGSYSVTAQAVLDGTLRF
jgi:hypothetical protein